MAAKAVSVLEPKGSHRGPGDGVAENPSRCRLAVGAGAARDGLYDRSRSPTA